MAMRMKTYLRKKREQMGTDYKPRTWAWVKSRWKPAKSYRFIKRGKKVGWVKVDLFYPEGKTVIVPVTCVRFAKNNEKSAK